MTTTPTIDQGEEQMEARAIPEGMKAWHGGDSAPSDWDGGEVWLRCGRLWKQMQPLIWGRPHGEHAGDIIAYTPIQSSPTETPDTEVGRLREADIDETVKRIRAARLGELTGIRCEHGWDTSVCPIRGCGDDEDELIEKLLAQLDVRTVCHVTLNTTPNAPAQAPVTEIERYQPHCCDCGFRSATGAELVFHQQNNCANEAQAPATVMPEKVREDDYADNVAEPYEDANYVAACLDSLSIADWQPNRTVWKDLCQVADALGQKLAALSTVQAPSEVEAVERVREALRTAWPDIVHPWVSYSVAETAVRALATPIQGSSQGNSRG